MNGITTSTRYVIPAAVVHRTRSLLAPAGRSGFEAAAVWVGKLVDANTAQVTRVNRPEQVTYLTPGGLAVELTERGLTALIRSLSADEAVLARLHTHGNADVDHSPVDDRNVVVAHPGAVSIVVPNFAADAITLTGCGVHVLFEDHRWRRLNRAQIKERFTVK